MYAVAETIWNFICCTVVGNCHINTICCVLMSMMQLSSKRFCGAAFHDYLIASASNFIFPDIWHQPWNQQHSQMCSTCMSAIISSELFQMPDAGLMSPFAVCLSALPLRPSFSVWVFVSVFRPPFPLRRRRGGSLDCRAAQMLKLSETFWWSGDEIWPNWGKAALMKGLDGELIMFNFTNEALHQQC